MLSKELFKNCCRFFKNSLGLENFKPHRNKTNPAKPTPLFSWWSSENSLSVCAFFWLPWECVDHAFHCTPLLWEELPGEAVLGWRGDAKHQAQLSGKELSALRNNQVRQRFSAEILVRKNKQKRGNEIILNSEKKKIQNQKSTYLNASRMALCKVQPPISCSHRYNCVYPLFCSS